MSIIHELKHEVKIRILYLLYETLTEILAA